VPHSTVSGNPGPTQNCTSLSEHNTLLLAELGDGLQDIVRLEASGALGEPDRGSRDSEFETTDAVDPTAVLADPVQEPVDELTCQKITPAREAILRMVIP